MNLCIAKTAKIYPGVIFEGDAVVEDYAIIGCPEDTDKKTRIGPGVTIRSHTVIYAGNVIGKNFSTGHHAMIREDNEIGDEVSIGSFCNVEHHVKIENKVRLHSGVFVPEYSVLEEDSWLGPKVTLTNARYPKSPGAKDSLFGPRIKRRARIGANSTILPGVIIGEDALVGAGSVVVRDVAPGDVAAGSPACVINRIENLPYKK